MTENNDYRGVKVEFLKPESEIAQALEKIGVPNRTERKLWPTCYAYQRKDGGQYIAHFKELLRKPNADEIDIQRRNLILKLLCIWKMIDIQDQKNEVFDNVWHKRLYILEDKQIEDEQWEIIHKIHENTLHYHRNRD